MPPQVWVLIAAFSAAALGVLIKGILCLIAMIRYPDADDGVKMVHAIARAFNPAADAWRQRRAGGEGASAPVTSTGQP